MDLAVIPRPRTTLAAVSNAGIPFKIDIPEAPVSALKMDRQQGPAAGLDVDRRPRAVTGGRHQGRSNRTGPAGEGFVLHTALIGSTAMVSSTRGVMKLTFVPAGANVR